MADALQNLCLCFLLFYGLEWTFTVAEYISDFDYNLYQLMAAYLNVSHLITHCNTLLCFEEVVVAAQRALNERGAGPNSLPVAPTDAEVRNTL